VWKEENPYGAKDNERSMFNIDAKQLMERLGIITQKALFQYLKVKYNTNSAFDDITDLLSSLNIHFDYYSD